MIHMTMKYEEDVIAWANEQARLLRAGRFDMLDIEHLADEIEDVGKSEKRELANRMAVLLCHLLKWQFQPERRGSSWKRTIDDQRKRLKRVIGIVPSLNGLLCDREWFEDAWNDGLLMAAKETEKEADTFPAACPWTTDEIMNNNFYPD
jgi:hypothetical protein